MPTKDKGRFGLGTPLHSHTGLSLAQAKPAGPDTAAEGIRPSSGHFYMNWYLLFTNIALWATTQKNRPGNGARWLTGFVQWQSCSPQDSTGLCGSKAGDELGIARKQPEDRGRTGLSTLDVRAINPISVTSSSPPTNSTAAIWSLSPPVQP